MPVKKLKPTKPPEIHDLVEELRREFEFGEDSPNKEPVIYTSEKTAQGPLHLYVVWSKWANLSQTYRSEIIMDAAEKVMKPDELIRVTLAMGLTESEWERFQAS